MAGKTRKCTGRKAALLCGQDVDMELAFRGSNILSQPCKQRCGCLFRQADEEEEGSEGKKSKRHKKEKERERRRSGRGDEKEGSGTPLPDGLPGSGAQEGTPAGGNGKSDGEL